MADEWTTEDERDRRTRVLVAEDETIIRLDLCGLLEQAGMDVCAAARNGEEAVELARSTRPDLALMDVRMPQLEGIEAARRILEERPLPIVRRPSRTPWPVPKTTTNRADNDFTVHRPEFILLFQSRLDHRGPKRVALVVQVQHVLHK